MRRMTWRAMSGRPWCPVWMHTRCVGISDAQSTPRRFTCPECEAGAALAAAAAAAAEAARLRPPPTLRRPLPEKIRGTKR